MWSGAPQMYPWMLKSCYLTSQMDLAPAEGLICSVRCVKTILLGQIRAHCPLIGVASASASKENGHRSYIYENVLSFSLDHEPSPTLFFFPRYSYKLLKEPLLPSVTIFWLWNDSFLFFAELTECRVPGKMLFLTTTL